MNRQIKRIPAEATYDLRYRILRPGRPLTSCHFRNDFAPDTFHLGAFRNDILVGILSVFHVPLPGQSQAWQLRAMATAPWVRGMGYGMCLLDAAEKMIHTQGAKTIWCNARVHATGFYEKAGYETSGDSFYIRFAGEHLLMTKQLSE